MGPVTWRRALWAVVAGAVLASAVLSFLFFTNLTRPVEHLPPIDPNDEFAVELREAHKELNSAVGWDDWRPRYIQGTAERLRRLASKYPNAQSPLLDAALHIETALKDGERRHAVIAHRAVSGLESLHRKARANR